MPLGVALLVATAVVGVTKKGARRWINLGIVIQPSEILKIAMPLMLAWCFQRREGRCDAGLLVALAAAAVPVGLIMKQPDLGTSLLVRAAGFDVIFFAGLSWKYPAGADGRRAGIGADRGAQRDRICQPDLKWPMLHDYQRHRV